VHVHVNVNVNGYGYANASRKLGNGASTPVRARSLSSLTATLPSR
jgi:hypothetical protein